MRMCSLFRIYNSIKSISLMLFIIPVILDASVSDNIIAVNNWTFEYQRDEIAPVAGIDSTTCYKTHPTLYIGGNGKAYANGQWTSTIPVTPNMFFQFTTKYLAINVEEPHRSVVARILWKNNKDEQIGTAEYPAIVLNHSDNWKTLQQIYKTPKDAVRARIELVYRWDADGTVYFGDTSLVPVDQPSPRYVNLASVRRLPRGSVSLEKNLQDFANLIAKAADQKADIVCLPEAVNMAGLGIDYVTAAEPIPGPTTEYLAKVAKKNNLYIVAGLLERDKEVVYNTAILLDRSGNLVGKYRKVSLPREEIEGGVTPGDSYLVFDTDFGRIGLLICWDVSFPEAVRSLSLQGAEAIFMPIWGGNITLAKARAIENQVYLVTSGYNMITAVFDHKGDILQQADDDNPVIVQQVDLNAHYYWPWLGDFKNRINREMPAEKAIRVKPE